MLAVERPRSLLNSPIWQLDEQDRSPAINVQARRLQICPTSSRQASRRKSQVARPLHIVRSQSCWHPLLTGTSDRSGPLKSALRGSGQYTMSSE
ncbi:MAG: hypothetical protein ACJA14_002356 [Ilumatobacter sp.]